MPSRNINLGARNRPRSTRIKLNLELGLQSLLVVLSGLARQMIDNQIIWTELRQSQAELRLTTQK